MKSFLSEIIAKNVDQLLITASTETLYMRMYSKMGQVMFVEDSL